MKPGNVFWHWHVENFKSPPCAEIIREYREIANEIKEETGTEPVHFLNWMESISNIVEPLPTGILSRDVDDNIFVGCALAANAKYIVSRDADLLALGKPFGIETCSRANFSGGFPAVNSNPLRASDSIRIFLQPFLNFALPLRFVIPVIFFQIQFQQVLGVFRFRMTGRERHF